MAKADNRSEASSEYVVRPWWQEPSEYDGLPRSAGFAHLVRQQLMDLSAKDAGESPRAASDVPADTPTTAYLSNHIRWWRDLHPVVRQDKAKSLAARLGKSVVWK